MGENERVTMERAKEILGLPSNTISKWAKRGDIPGAARFGRRWTFNLDKLRDLVRVKERETWQDAKRRQGVTGGAIPSGLKRKSPVNATGGHFKQTIQKLRENAAKLAKQS